MIVVNVARARVDAILLQQAADVDPAEEPVRISAVELDLDADLAARQSARYIEAVGEARAAHRSLTAAARAGRPPERARLVAFETAIEEIGELLAWGWDTITGPALEALGHRAAPEEGLPWPRIRWCATGPLSVFPLFATGHHDGSGRAVIDRVVSSEAPTLRILAGSARQAASDGRTPGLLVVSVPTPFDRTDVLRGVREETAAVADSAPLPVTVLEDSDATRGALLSGLGEYAWFHFAGHGARGLTAPTDTALSAFDGPVTLADLAALRTGGGEFAYLSACHGADAHDRHPDEALHLAAAVHLAGFRHVVAARHELDDRVATRTATVFYQQLRVDGDPGLALHGALRRMRRELSAPDPADGPVNPWDWTGYVHLGP